MGKQHGELIQDIIENVNRSGAAWVWKVNTGVFKSFDGKRTVRIGLKGQADITGILKDGRRIELEAKVGKDTQRLEQKQFQFCIERMGGVYGVVESLEDALHLVQEALRPKGC